MTLHIILAVSGAIIALLAYKLGQLKERLNDAEIKSAENKKNAEISSRPHSSGADIRNRMHSGNM